MVLPAKSVVLLFTSSATPASCRAVVMVNSVSVPLEIHCPVPAGGGEVFHHDLLFRYALRQGIGVAGSRLGKGDGLLIAFAVRIVDGGNVIAFPLLFLHLSVQSRDRHHQLSTMHKVSSSADTRFLCCFMCRFLPL